MGESVDIAGPDGTFKAYVAMPAGAPKGAVVVLQEIFGVNAGIRGKADWLAKAGFVAIAPDLFWRVEPGVELTEADMERAFGLMTQLDKNASVRDVQAVIDHAREKGAPKVGVLGYCMGGYIAFLAACRTNSDASIAYHGGGIQTALPEAGAIKAPVMLHNPMKDSLIPVEALNEIREGLKDNPQVIVHEYADQDHAFTREGGHNYDQDAAQRADARSVEFLERHLS